MGKHHLSHENLHKTAASAPHSPLFTAALMTSPESTSGSTSIEQRLISIERAARMMGITILLLSSAPNLALAYSIRSYASAISAALAHHGQSSLVRWVFENPGHLLLLAVLLPLIGVVIAMRARDSFRAMTAACVYLVLVTIQFTLTWMAFVAPIKEMVGMLSPR